MTLDHLDARCALINVDLQNGVRALPYTHPVQGVIDNAALLADAFRAHDRPVVITVANSTGVTPLRTDAGFAAPASLPPGWDEPVAELHRDDDDLFLSKARWGSFAGTGLDDWLRERGVTQVVLTGVATGFGVESTARGCADRGYNVVVATDAVTDMDADVHANSVQRIFPRLGQCATTSEVLAALDATGR